MNQSFSGVTLSEIFQLQPLQSLFIKFWYLGLTSQSIVAHEDNKIFKAIKKNITFANCFTYQMPLKTYINFIDRINLTLQKIQPKKTFDILLGHLRNNKVNSVSFQLFGVSFLQLFGRLLQLINTEIMNKILRRIFMQLTMISKSGIAIMKTNLKNIQALIFEQYIPNFSSLVEQPIKLAINPQNPEQMTINFEPNQIDKQILDVKTLKGRLQSQRNYNIEARQAQSGAEYPVGQKMKNKDQTNISCFVMGGFEIVDYSDNINLLHKKLLTKILLNK